MSSTVDSFARTAAALLVTLDMHGTLLSSNVAQFRNYLLDECGSDHRALVDLMLSVGPMLQSRFDPQDVRTPWETRRAPHVHQLVATRFLQPDVARWLVDAWGAALGVAPRHVNSPVMAFDVASRTASAAPPSINPVAPRVPLTPPSRAGRGAVRAVATASTPSTSAMFTRPGVARQVPARSSASRATTARWRTLSPAMNASQLTQIRRIEQVSLGLIAFAGVAVFIAAGLALSGRKTERIADVAVLPSIAPGTPADSVSRAAVGPMQALPASTPSAASLDTLASDTLFHGEAVGVRPTPARVPSGAQLIAAGLGGRYRVVQRIRSVDGSPSCADVAAALANGRTSIEVLSHTPGTFAFAITSRAVTGVIDADANFDAGPRSGTTDGVTWEFRMRGQFTAGGFIGESRTSTEAIIRWGRTQSCMTVADLVAERMAP